MPRSRILVIDDEPSVTDALELVVSELGHLVNSAKSGGEAKELLKGSPYDLVFTDIRLPDASGIDLLAHIKSDTPNTEVIVMTAHGSLDLAIEAIKRGAFYYIEKPFTPDQVTTLVQRALQFEAIKRENRSLKSALMSDSDDFGIIGRDPKMRQIHSRRQFATTPKAFTTVSPGLELATTLGHTREKEFNAESVGQIDVSERFQRWVALLRETQG